MLLLYKVINNNNIISIIHIKNSIMCIIIIHIFCYHGDAGQFERALFSRRDSARFRSLGSTRLRFTENIL